MSRKGCFIAIVSSVGNPSGHTETGSEYFLSFYLSTLLGLMTCSKHIRESEKPVLCPYCDLRMSYQSDMRKHAVTHVNPDDRLRIPCPICGEEFTRNCNMLKHKREQHQPLSLSLPLSR